MMNKVCAVIGCAALFFAGPPAGAATCTSQCDGGFEFLVGDWFVKNRAGQPIATDAVWEAGACTLIEHWRGVNDTGDGLAVTTYRVRRRTWHREALIRSSTVISFEGRTVGRTMVMAAKQYAGSSISPTLHRITWTPKRDGSIEELWQVSNNGGASWHTQFDEFLVRIAE